MTNTPDLAAQVAELLAQATKPTGPALYNDATVPLDDRIRAAEAAGDHEWSRSLKHQKARSLMTTIPAIDPDTAAKIREAEAAGDHVEARRLKNLANQQLRKVRDESIAPNVVARQRELLAQRAAEREARRAEEEADLERRNELARQEHDAIRRLPKEARDLAMHRRFGGPPPSGA